MELPDTYAAIESAQRKTFARGWYVLGMAKHFAGGRPHTVTAFGKRLVVFEARDTHGLFVLDAICPHLGTDLGTGRVRDASIVCPTHGWVWDGGSGRCTDIPYAEKVPGRFETKKFASFIQDGFLYVWHDSEDGLPEPSQVVPEIHDSQSEWTAWDMQTVEIPTITREVIDNAVDMAHFFYIHYAIPQRFTSIFDGWKVEQYFKGLPRYDIYPENPNSVLSSDSVTTLYGPAILIGEMKYHFRDFDLSLKIVNFHYPIDSETVRMNYDVTVRRDEALPGKIADKVSEEFRKLLTVGFEQDIEIWKNKQVVDRPFLSDVDGPIYRMRRWYQQFFVSPDNVENDMVRREVIELDTTSAVTSWSTEVAQNISDGAAQLGA